MLPANDCDPPVVAVGVGSPFADGFFGPPTRAVDEGGFLPQLIQLAPGADKPLLQPVADSKAKTPMLKPTIDQRGIETRMAHQPLFFAGKGLSDGKDEMGVAVVLLPENLKTPRHGEPAAHESHPQVLSTGTTSGIQTIRKLYHWISPPRPSGRRRMIETVVGWVKAFLGMGAGW